MATDPRSSGGANLTLAFIGDGRMASEVLTGILQSNLNNSPISKFILYVQTREQARKWRKHYRHSPHCLTIVRRDILRPFSEADIIILGFLPSLAESILGTTGVRAALRGKVIISLLAGVPTYRLEDIIHDIGGRPLIAAHAQPIDPNGRCCIIRAATNLAAGICEAMTLVTNLPINSSQGNRDIINWIFSQVGKVEFIENDVFDVASVLTGASAAFMSTAFEGLLDGAVCEGLEREIASSILHQSLLGMAKLLATGLHHPSYFREQSSSPRGMSIQGSLVLEAGNVRSSYSKALLKAITNERRL